jgi:tetratricopeptide (TPR) repeat protein
VSALYNLVNVPTGVMIDEAGRIVRLDEGAYTRKYKAGALEFGTDEYVPALRDWVEKGSASAYAKDERAMAEQLAARTPEQAQADAAFRLGVYFHDQGDAERADRYWQRAQELDPDSWNYHRQDWSFTPAEAGPNWLRKFQALGDKPYYRPMELKAAASEP